MAAPSPGIASLSWMRNPSLSGKRSLHSSAEPRVFDKRYPSGLVAHGHKSLLACSGFAVPPLSARGSRHSDKESDDDVGQRI